LLERLGFEKARDLWSWELPADGEVPARVARLAAFARRDPDLRVRHVDMRDFESEVNVLREIYNEAWEHNWGFVPMTDREFRHQCAQLRRIVRPELLLIAEVSGDPAAFALTLPDANQALRRARGRLTTCGAPTGLIRLLLGFRRIDRLRLAALGIKQQYRGRGLDAVLYDEMLRVGHGLGFPHKEVSWTLEDNRPVNAAIEAMGGVRTKTHRIYRKPLI
jgi:GNAT superfamily N-acetyltransferase